MKNVKMGEPPAATIEDGGRESLDIAPIRPGDRPGGPVVPDIISGPAAGARRLWVEIPSTTGTPAAWCYSDRRSYSPGETVRFFVSATEPALKMSIYRDGFHRELVHESVNPDVPFQAVPDAAYEVGCGWTQQFSFDIPDDVVPGAYLVELSREGRAPGPALGHHLFVIRPSQPRRGALALVLATSTWAAYNDWGGASHYYGVRENSTRGRSPYLSVERPWARGQVWLPDGAPRMVNEQRPRYPRPARYEPIEWAFLNGYSKYYASAGWASYERHFVRWAEQRGYVVDIFTQDDLHMTPEMLRPYACAVFVGHDEYWTWEMREAVDQFVEGGGRVARFAGNFMWQIRLEDKARRQVAFKYDARHMDPIVGTEQETRMTGAWEDPLIGNPGATTFGVNALRGMYAGYGAMAPRSARGFNVFRPAHWSLEGTGLGYADMFGDEASIFAFEMDGVDYEFKDGLPHPTHTDGAPPGLEIVAMNWSTAAEYGLPEHEDSFMLGDSDAQFRAALFDDAASQASVERHARMSGMVVSFTRGQGEVFTAGTCEWVNGLVRGDFYVEAVTANVLNRFGRPSG